MTMMMMEEEDNLRVELLHPNTIARNINNNNNQGGAFTKDQGGN